MKFATDNQIINVAKIHDSIGCDDVSFYGVTGDKKTRYKARCYRDSFWNLARSGILKYNDNYTYSLVK